MAELTKLAPKPRVKSDAERFAAVEAYTVRETPKAKVHQQVAENRILIDQYFDTQDGQWSRAVVHPRQKSLMDRFRPKETNK